MKRPPANRPKTFNREFAACIIIDAELLGVATTCNTHKTTRSTIKRYRDRLVTDTELQRIVTLKKASVTPVSVQPAAKDVLESCVDFIQRAAIEGNPRDPEMIHAITGAFKTIADARRADRALEEYLNALHAQNPVSTRNGSAHPVITVTAASTNVRA